MRAIKEIGCELSPVTFNWLMTLFVDSVPAEVRSKKLCTAQGSKKEVGWKHSLLKRALFNRLRWK